MADNLLHIDDDWKRQAQEEKRRLAEEEARKKAEATTAPAGTVGGMGGSFPPGASVAPGAAAGASTSGSGRRRTGQAPEASLAGLVQSLVTQALFYLGDLGTRSGQTMVDLDMAKLQIDLLGVLEAKTQGNLTEQEKQLLDTALYEVRMRFVAVAREHATT